MVFDTLNSDLIASTWCTFDCEFLSKDAKSGTFLAEIFFALNLVTWFLFRSLDASPGTPASVIFILQKAVKVVNVNHQQTLSRADSASLFSVS